MIVIGSGERPIWSPAELLTTQKCSFDPPPFTVERGEQTGFRRADMIRRVTIDHDGRPKGRDTEKVARKAVW